MTEERPGKPLARFLCAADVHLGRRPSRIPSSLSAFVDSSSLSASAAWGRLIELAMAERVDGLLLAGDLVEKEDDFYEAYADLHRGVKRLAEAGIPVVAVAGNHDLKVLPRLAQVVPSFKLLGANGTWENFRVECESGAEVNLLGWSFPNDGRAAQPFGTSLPELPSGVTLGLLHCDRDGGAGTYGPVRSSELLNAPVDTWLLGHIHKPDPLLQNPTGGYLGSLSAMDPGEAGQRGAWLLSLGGRSPSSFEALPLGPLRWEEAVVDVTALTHVEDVHGHILAAIDRLDERLQSGRFRPRAVGVRVILKGRSRLGESIRRELQSTDPRSEPYPRESGITYFVHDVRNRVMPAIELTELAASSDPAGLVARRVLLLRGEGDPHELQRLLDRARSSLARVAGRSQFGDLGEREPSDKRICDLLEDAALRLLDELLSQKERAA